MKISVREYLATPALHTLILAVAKYILTIDLLDTSAFLKVLNEKRRFEAILKTKLIEYINTLKCFENS